MCFGWDTENSGYITSVVFKSVGRFSSLWPVRTTNVTPLSRNNLAGYPEIESLTLHNETCVLTSDLTMILTMTLSPNFKIVKEVRQQFKYLLIIL